jgi:hypothetical protein
MHRDNFNFTITDYCIQGPTFGSHGASLLMLVVLSDLCVVWVASLANIPEAHAAS